MRSVVKKLKRLLLQQLLDWKKQDKRKPVLLDGARQTGKSYLLETLFGAHFAQVVRLDFLEQPNLADVFDGSLKPDDILANIELALDLQIDRAKALIIFDEIGECQAAVDCLKFFSEQKPELFICASGSNIGLLGSFPVGKVELLELYPLTFEEFLWAAEQPLLVKVFDEMNLSRVAHDRLFGLLVDYYYVGGMPEAVAAWFGSSGMDGVSIIERTGRVSRIHSALIAGYERDFGKYSKNIAAQQINAIFRNVPRQLAQHVDDSVKRFKFKDVIENASRYQQLAGPIDWLERCKLVSKCHPVGSQPTSPLLALSKENIFKLFFFDIGLLGHLLGLSYNEHREQGFSYKGYIAENFVQNEWVAQGGGPTYSWEYARSEIEFIVKSATDALIPIEVKSGKRTRAKSLGVYVQRYSPQKTIKLVGSTGSVEDPRSLVLPLYFASKVRQLA